MKNSAHRIRIVTYNIHKCCGLDRRVSPARIVEVLREIDADIIALQEVVCIANGAREYDQARFFAEELAYDYCLGENRQVRGGVYGNVVLSRLPVRASRNYDISWRRWERRGCLRADIELTDNSLLHIFNVHEQQPIAVLADRLDRISSPLQVMGNVELQLHIPGIAYIHNAIHLFGTFS